MGNLIWDSPRVIHATPEGSKQPLIFNDDFDVKVVYARGGVSRSVTVNASDSISSEGSYSVYGVSSSLFQHNKESTSNGVNYIFFGSSVVNEKAYSQYDTNYLTSSGFSDWYEAWSVDLNHMVAMYGRDSLSTDRMLIEIYSDANSSSFDFDNTKIDGHSIDERAPYGGVGYYEGSSYMFIQGLNTDGSNPPKLIKIDPTTKTLSHSVVEPLPSASIGLRTFGLPNNRFLCLYADDANSRYSTAVIATVNSDTSVSYGTPIVFSTDGPTIGTSKTWTYSNVGESVIAAWGKSNGIQYVRFDTNGDTVTMSNIITIDAVDSNPNYMKIHAREDYNKYYLSTFNDVGELTLTIGDLGYEEPASIINDYTIDSEVFGFEGLATVTVEINPIYQYEITSHAFDYTGESTVSGVVSTTQNANLLFNAYVVHSATNSYVLDGLLSIDGKVLRDNDYSEEVVGDLTHSGTSVLETIHTYNLESEITFSGSTFATNDFNILLESGLTIDTGLYVSSTQYINTFSDIDITGDALLYKMYQEVLSGEILHDGVVDTNRYFTIDVSLGYSYSAESVVESIVDYQLTQDFDFDIGLDIQTKYDVSLYADYDVSGFVLDSEQYEHMFSGDWTISGGSVVDRIEIFIPTLKRPHTLWANNLDTKVSMKELYTDYNEYGEEIKKYRTEVYFWGKANSLKFAERRRLQKRGYNKVIKLFTGPYDIKNEAHFEIDGQDYKLVNKEEYTDHRDLHTVLFLEEV